MPLSVDKLFKSNQESLQLSWVEQCGCDRSVCADDAQGVESADLIGHLNLIHPNRIHVLGEAELAYFARLDEARKRAVVRDLVAGNPPAVIVAEGLRAPDDLLAEARKCELPVIESTLSSARVIDALRAYVTKTIAPTVLMHGVFMDVLGMGVLISGESGLGKSELALELISRGHGLVADDQVEFTRVARQVIEGRCPALLQNMLEVRGLGVLDIRTIFGETAVRRKMKLKLIVHLVGRRTMENEYQRLPLEALTQDVLGIPVRKVVIPVMAGRNLAVLTEAAVRSAVLQLRGIDTTAEFIERQRRLIQAGDA